MVPMEIQLPSQRRDSLGHVLTHGFVHGHVHQHRDHVHIHGHIHNHDHVEQSQDHGHSHHHSHQHSHQNGAGLEDAGESALCNHTLSELECKELENSFDLCNEIFCDELDDCYYYDCDKPDGELCGTGHCEEYDPDAEVPGECCDDEACLTAPAPNVCTDAGCIKTEHHDNSLCEHQKPRLTIFENLIQNVHKNIEQYGAPTAPVPSTVNPVDAVNGSVDTAGYTPQPAKLGLAMDNLQFHIHFPHHCHQEQQEQQQQLQQGPQFTSKPLNAGNPDAHTLHQSCFHARLPTTWTGAKSGTGEQDSAAAAAVAAEQQRQQQDYDFFVQFNNFKQIFNEPDAKVSEIKDPQATLGHAQVNPTHTFSCKWENCLQPVDNESLMQHLVGSHLGHDPLCTDHASGVKLECEWDDCGFVDENLQLFLDHLNTHRHEEVRPKGEMLPLLTPSSMEAACELPHKYNIKTETELSILEMRILPKKAPVVEPADPLHTCKWEIGTDADGQPILCNRVHATDGDLQEHLKLDHIGRGKLIYHCCWHGCDRNHGKPFQQRQKLFRHIHIHTGHKPCVCSECGALFAVPSMLKQHQRIHSGEKPYECLMCGRCFATSSSLAIHTRVHTDSRPLECTWPGCGKRFRESLNLAKHMRTHLTKFRCEDCGKEFDSRRSFTRHVKTHRANVLALLEHPTAESLVQT